MPSAQYNSVSAKITAPVDTEFVYKTEQPIFLGWQIIDVSKKEKDEIENNKNYQYITTLKQNINMPPKKIDCKFTMNELKSHYTEARLVQLLEEKGIGRPSTFASLVDKIQERKYVEKQNITGKEIECIDFSLNNTLITETTLKREFGNEKNKLVIQPLGIIVIEFLLSKFDMFFNYEYTKQMEDSLDLISNGKTNWVSLCDTCFKELTNTMKDLNDLLTGLDVDTLDYKKSQKFTDLESKGGKFTQPESRFKTQVANIKRIIPALLKPESNEGKAESELLSQSGPEGMKKLYTWSKWRFIIFRRLP
jgi:DNA topoisomerase-1